jgi:hypothetical protein
VCRIRVVELQRYIAEIFIVNSIYSAMHLLLMVDNLCMSIMQAQTKTVLSCNTFTKSSLISRIGSALG